ncbi:MAG TPA: VIT domain-containing protein, partial [Kofleriaceae bacterium]|nr:VIT domain-containing protein [Kofleriaceae bacterium]
MTTTTTCDQVTAELSDLIDGDPAAIGRHADHLAGCADCRDARHDAARLAALVADAGIDHAPPGDLAARVLAALDRSVAGSAAAAEPGTDQPSARHRDRTPMPRAATQRGWQAVPPAGRPASQGSRQRRWAAVAAATAIAAAAAAMVVRQAGQPAGTAANESSGALAAGGPVGVVTRLERAGVPGAETGVALHEGARWRSLGRDEVVPAGAELRTDDRTRAALTLADGTQLVLDHATVVAFAPDDARRIRLTAGRLAADLARRPGRSATITTPTGRIDVAAAAGAPRAGDPGGTSDAPDRGDASHPAARAATSGGASHTPDRDDARRIPDRDDARHPPDRGARRVADGARFTVTATDALTSVQVARDAVVLANQRGERDEVRAGEEGVVEAGALSVSPAPGLVRDAAWAELAPPAQPDEAASGLGALRAYKPGERRDRDWNLALARHDVRVRVVGPIARTEITETFRNDSAATLEGVYQFPLPPDAQIDGLALDVAGGFVDGAFVDKERGQKIWRGVIDRATPRSAPRPSQEIIWVEGRWRDPALLDWKRGGRFELRVYPIPAHGARTIKLAYTQVVAPRGPWREYSYPLPHSRDGSTVADLFTVDVELRGAVAGQVRAVGYDLVADPARAQVNALTLRQSGFVPRGDLVVAYRAEAGDAELRAWTFAGGAAAAPDDKLAGKRGVGIDPKVVAAQRAIAADLRPTAVLALRPRLPRWRDGAPRDYMIVVDASQSMVGERFTRATELAAAIVEQMDRRDRFGAMVCDSECRPMADPGGPAMARNRAGASDPANGTGPDAVPDAVIDPSAPITARAARAVVTAGAAELRSPSPQAASDVRGWLAAQQPAGASDLVTALRAAGVRLGPGRGAGPADD